MLTPKNPRKSINNPPVQPKHFLIPYLFTWNYIHVKLRHKNLNIKIESSLSRVYALQNYIIYSYQEFIQIGTTWSCYTLKKTNALFLKGLVQCLKFDHISYRSITANLQSLQFVTRVIMHACC